MNNKPDQYIPGTCNIGHDELAKRKIELVIGGIATALLTALSFWFYDSLLIWFLLFVSSGFTALMYLQITNRFCVLFGWFRRYNFGKLGSLQKINDPGQVARDRKKVLVIGLQTLVVSLLYTGIIYLLSKSFHF